MIIESSMIALIIYVIKYIRESDKHEIKNKFNESMKGLGLKNKLDKTFKIRNIKNTSYGYSAYISIPSGLSKQHLEDKTNILEDNLDCLIEMYKYPFKSGIHMHIIDKDIFTFKFEPVAQKANELYIGRDIKQEAYKIDLNKNPMILICGLTGQGKTMLLSSIITNLMYNCRNEVEFWFAQLIKGEMHSFDNCNQTKMSAYSYEDVSIMILKIRDILDKRSSLFKQYGIRNITQWNKHYPKRKMKRIIVVCEEASELMEYPELWAGLWGITKAGRSVGIHLIACMQRITATNIDTNVRSQMTKITFRQNNESDSRLTIGSNAALELKQGECIVDVEGLKKIKVPFIDDDFAILNKYVPEIKIPGDEVIQKCSKNISTSECCNLISEKPKIIDVSPKQIKPIKSKKRKGVISLEELSNDNKTR